MDYSATLNLPKTDFPMRGNLPNKEPEMQSWWESIDIYKKVQAHRQGREKFVLHDGPPFSNGDIHIGHAMNKILKDFIVRYKSMQGYDAPYIPGWDTHGLPIEQAIANSKKVDRKKMTVDQFREYCAQYAMGWVEKQKEQFMRLGVRGDWDEPYLTMTPAYEAAQIRVFGQMVSQGYIYKGLKPIYWSPSSESALADAEIEYHDVRSPSIYVAFQVKDDQGKLPDDTAIVIWTTTPWTLPANLGISLHPEFDYVVVKTADRHYVVAQGLLNSVASEVGWTDIEIVQQLKGSELEHMTCQHPFYDRESLVMTGEHVTLEAGTGCVHTAPGHGEDDFIIGQRYGLDVLCPVDEYGKFTSEAPGFEGVFYDKANKMITEQLESTGALLKLNFIQHQYPHDWRTKKPVIFRATEQWFASIDKAREAILSEIKQVAWTPKWGEVRLHNMIADRGDWCISRQRVWGVPIPIFYCQSCQEPLVNEETIDHVANIFAEEGSNAWFQKDVKELLPSGMACAACGHTVFTQETDTMDVWFDSGSSHAAVLETREELQSPADLYLEGSDQYRGWYNSSIITSVAVRGRAPYKGVLSTGFTLDGEGRKMSKSLGNTVDPIKVCNTLGADILRLWVASADYQSDVRISDAILKQIAEAYRKIRNTLRFLLGNLSDFDPEQHRVERAEMSELDHYALVRLNRLIERVSKAYDEYDFHIVYQGIHHFCSEEMSAFYLDIVKDRLYVNAHDAPVRRAVQTVLYETLHTIARLIAPILPHTAEEVWRHVPGVTEESIQLTDFPETDDSLYDDVLENKWKNFSALRDEVLKALEMARQNKVIGNSLSAKVNICPDKEAAAVLDQFAELEQLFIVSDVQIHESHAGLPDEAVQLEQMMVAIEPAPGDKCERCWMISPHVGEDAEHTTLCPRCADIVKEHHQG